jgi:hypothetical protein
MLFEHVEVKYLGREKNGRIEVSTLPEWKCDVATGA